MNKKLVTCCSLVLSLALLLVSCAPIVVPSADNTVAAEDVKSVAYPEKEIEIIIPWAAGGGTDILTRKVMEYLELPVSVVPVNIEGAGALTGSMEAYHANPDGYTLLANTPLNLASHSLSGSIDVELWKEMRTICFVVEDYTIVGIRSDLNISSVEDFVDFATSNPGELKWGVMGAKTIAMADSLLVADGLGVECTMVPYDSNPNLRAAVLGGHCDVVTQSVSDFSVLAESGDVVPLIIIAPERSVFYPDCPTTLEKGVNIASGTMRAFYAPPGTPDDVMDYLAEAFKKVCENEEFITSMREGHSMNVAFTGREEAEPIVEEWVAMYTPLFESFKE